jgi:hypothetical protein
MLHVSQAMAQAAEPLRVDRVFACRNASEPLNVVGSSKHRALADWGSIGASHRFAMQL